MMIAFVLSWQRPCLHALTLAWVSISQGSVACRKLYKGPQEELWAEKCRRTAKHDKPLHTLQTLHRMKSF